MEQMAKNIIRETAEKEGLSQQETEDIVKEKAAEFPKWEEEDDHLKAKNDMKEALEEVISEADPNLESVKEAKEVLESEQFTLTF